MQSRILLINFSKDQSLKLEQTMGVTIDRGFLSDIEQEITSFNYDQVENEFSYYFPHSISEYKVIIINLNKNSKVESEFSTRIKPYDVAKYEDFRRFYFKGGVIIVFLGDYKHGSLAHIGNSMISLQRVTDHDLSKNFCISPDTPFRKKLESVVSTVNMPTDKYIVVDDSVYDKSLWQNHSYQTFLKNNAGDALAYFHDLRGKFTTRSELERARYIVLPQFSNNLDIAKKIILELVKATPSIIPEIKNTDWKELDKFYPKALREIDIEISSEIQRSSKVVETLENEKKKIKKQYVNLVTILSSKGDALKEAIIDILKSVFLLKVIDSDESAEGLPNEDVIIEYEGDKYLGEVKGDIRNCPPPTHIIQVLKHLHHSKDKTIKAGMLILNHDYETSPENRSLAYTGEFEDDLSSIIYLDTRILHSLALAIIDNGLNPGEAVKYLFKLGRVTFKMKDHNKLSKVVDKSNVK